MSIKTLKAPEFTEDEQAQIVTDLLALKKTQIGKFLESVDLPKSGTKDEIKNRIEEALDGGGISLAKVVEFLDEVIPWGKQHVYLYKGPSSSIDNWKKADKLVKLLAKHQLKKYLNAKLPLALPEKMRVSSILHDGDRLRVTAIKKRDWWERNDDYDDEAVTEEGEDVDLRAFVHRVTRSLVSFEWDLNANVALLQIAQLPTGLYYDDVAKEFFELVKKWLDVKLFSVVDLRPLIKKLHRLESTANAETRSHGRNYRSLEGRAIDIRSASKEQPVLGEVKLDAALADLEQSGVARIGNFYWLPKTLAHGPPNPLDDELHVIVIGSRQRISFPTPNNEQTLRYVLSRIRSHSA